MSLAVRLGLRRAAEPVQCTVLVEHTNEHLHAHVELDGEVQVNPGDRVIVHGAPIKVAFGERQSFRRTATVERAGRLEQLWTRWRGNFELTELYEVGVLPRSAP